MSTPWIDPARSRIVLVGVPAYADGELQDYPVIGGNVTGLLDAFTDPAVGGLDPAGCFVAPPEAGTGEIGQLLGQAAAEAEDLLLFYYCGHGLIGAGRDRRLYLSVYGTRKGREAYTALPFEAVRQDFLGSRAKRRVVILDCCFSGRAIGGALSPRDMETATQFQIDSSYILASAPSNQSALVLEGEQHTAFTGRLLDVLREGRPGAGEALTLADIHALLRSRLIAAGLPELQDLATGGADRLPLVRNRSYATTTDEGSAGSSPDAQLRSAIVNIANRYLKLAKTRTTAQISAMIWGGDTDGASDGDSGTAFARLALELGAQVTGQASWVRGGDTLPPADARAPATLDVSRLRQDAEARARWHAVGGEYEPQPGDFVVLDDDVKVITSYSGGTLKSIGAQSRPEYSVSARTFTGPLAEGGIVGFIDNGHLDAAPRSFAQVPAPAPDTSSGTNSSADTSTGSSSGPPRPRAVRPQVPVPPRSGTTRGVAMIPGLRAPRPTPPAAERYRTPLPVSVATAFMIEAKMPIGRSEYLYRDVASHTEVSWKFLAAIDWMQYRADPRCSPVHGERLGTVNRDGSVYLTRSDALTQCAFDITELASAVYGIDLTKPRALSIRALAEVFAAFRWGLLLKKHGVSPMEFPYSVAGLTHGHTKMRWPAIHAPEAPDKPGSRFKQPFGAVPLLLCLKYPAIV